MATIDDLLQHYGESHRNPTNKLIHWICIPAIVFTLIGLIYCIPYPFATEKTWLNNWAGIFFLAVLIYYFRLSLPMFLGFVALGFFLLYGNDIIAKWVNNTTIHLQILGAIFVIAWIGQFIGHKIEGKKPSFLEDIQYLLIGPAWLMHFIFKKLGIPYK